MEILVMMVMMSTVLALVVPIAIGLTIGSDHDRTLLGLAAGTVAGFLLAWAVSGFGMAMVHQTMKEQLAQEAPRETYASIAALKGRHCDVDAAIAAAMKDRVLSNGDARYILAVNEPHAMAEARAKLSDVSSKEGCSTSSAPAGAPVR